MAEQVSCPKCGGYKLTNVFSFSDFYVYTLGIRVIFALITGKPKPKDFKLTHKCEICGYIFEKTYLV